MEQDPHAPAVWCGLNKTTNCPGCTKPGDEHFHDCLYRDAHEIVRLDAFLDHHFPKEMQAARDAEKAFSAVDVALSVLESARLAAKDLTSTEAPVSAPRNPMPDAHRATENP